MNERRFPQVSSQIGLFRESSPETLFLDIYLDWGKGEGSDAEIK